MTTLARLDLLDLCLAVTHPGAMVSSSAMPLGECTLSLDMANNSPQPEHPYQGHTDFTRTPPPPPHYCVHPTKEERSSVSSATLQPYCEVGSLGPHRDLRVLKYCKYLM